MQRLTLDLPVPDTLRGAVLALGTFDGFHLGHQAVVGRAVQRGAHECAAGRPVERDAGHVGFTADGVKAPPVRECSQCSH
jgi:phosphopantetheine adenylyltransferase